MKVIRMSLIRLKNVNRNAVRISGFFILMFLFFLIIFYKERNIFLIFKFYFGLIYLFILPGFLILSLLFNKLCAFDRLLLSLPFGTALIGVFTFLFYTYFGIKVKTVLYFPLLIFLFYLVVKIKGKLSNKNKPQPI